MSGISRILLVFAAVVMLFSCTMEKRQYRSGYYISFRHEVKNTHVENMNAGLSASTDTNEKYILLAEKKITKAGQPMLLLPEPEKKRGLPKSKHPRKHFADKPIVQKKLPEENTLQPLSPDDEPVKKDAKQLLIGAIGAFLISLVYGFAIIKGIVGLANIAFILIPFAIIGLWIFALLLHNKYAEEEPYNSSGKRRERVYSQRLAFLLAGFLGIFGSHRFYLGYIKVGLFEMFTLGGFLVMYFIDMIRIKSGKLKPLEGVYSKAESSYSHEKRSKVSNKTMKVVRLALLISILALLAFLGFAIFA